VADQRQNSPPSRPVGMGQREKDAAKWRLVHGSGTPTVRRRRSRDGVELLGEPRIEECPPEVVVRALFTKETLAEYLRVSVYTVMRLVQDGMLTAIKVGNQVRFHIEDVDRFLDQSRIGGSDERTRGQRR
jgi:excisionase family DNA binding protein